MSVSRSFVIASPHPLKTLVTECHIARVSAGPGTSIYQPFLALWDTGATNTVVSFKVRRLCGLVKQGKAGVLDLRGKSRRETYYVDLRLHNDDLFTDLQVVQGTLRDVDVLIGMDIISQGDFAVCNHMGGTTMSYRRPSRGIIDFTRGPKIGTV